MRSYLVLSLLALLSNCNGTANLIQGITLVATPTPALNQPVSFILNGVGKCTDLTIAWGDGFPLDHNEFVDLAAHRVFTHTYSDWPGGKTVTAQGVTGCAGTARTRFTIEPSLVTIVWARDPTRNIQMCVATPGQPDLASNSLVHITSPPSQVVNFSCQFNGCIYDADGRPGSAASASFPFPGLREYSLVLRVGTQVFQGGKSVQFTVPTGGTLELCQNTDKPETSTGGWEVDIKVDELGR
jgi:hypothetical protein